MQCSQNLDLYPTRVTQVFFSLFTILWIRGIFQTYSSTFESDPRYFHNVQWHKTPVHLPNASSSLPVAPSCLPSATSGFDG